MINDEFIFEFWRDKNLSIGHWFALLLPETEGSNNVKFIPTKLMFTYDLR